MTFGRTSGVLFEELCYNRFYILDPDVQDSAHYEEAHCLQ